MSKHEAKAAELKAATAEDTCKSADIPIMEQRQGQEAADQDTGLRHSVWNEGCHAVDESCKGGNLQDCHQAAN